MEVFSTNQYFSGPSGLYYLPENDELVVLTKVDFTLIPVKIKPRPTVQAVDLYDVEFENQSFNRIAVTDFRNIIFIGEIR